MTALHDDLPFGRRKTDSREVLVAAIARLPHLQRTAMSLRYERGMGVQAVAQALRTDEAGALALLEDALAALRPMLRNHGRHA